MKAVIAIVVTIFVFPVDEIFKTIERENVADINLDINEEAIEAIEEAELASIINDPLVVPESDQSLIEQFLDLATTPKIGIAVDVTLIDSDFRRIDVPTNFLNIPATILPLTLLDADGNIFDLGSVTIGFTAVSNLDTILDVSGKFDIFLNDKPLATQDFFGRGTPDADNKLKLQTTGGKDAVTFIFQDEPPTAFIVGTTLDNSYSVFIKEVSITAGEGFDTVVYGFKGNFNAYTLRLQFNEDGVVVRDNTGTAISVFPSDSTIKSCGQNRGHINNFIGSTDIGFGVTARIVQVFDDPNGLPIVTSVLPVFGNREADAFRQGCGTVVSGIPRDSELIFRVAGLEFNVTTEKTQQNFVIDCRNTFSKTVLRQISCTSNFAENFLR